MNDEKENTKARFFRNIDEIALDFIRMVGLEFKKEIPHLSDPLHRWMDFRLRYIDPVPRQVFLSDKFPKKLPPIVSSSLQKMVDKLQSGIDINPYQSKGLIRFNDISTKRRNKRTDLLWADWRITHLHLTDRPIQDGEYFSDRRCSNGECWLLFCIVTGDTVALVDVRAHEDESLFADLDLIKTVKRCWPDFMNQFRLIDILPGKDEFTNSEMQSLRANGISAPVFIDGNVYMGPGMGVTSASTSLRVTIQADRVLNWVSGLACLADDENGQLQIEVKRHGVEKPKFELAITAHGLAIYETETRIAFTLTKKGDDENSIQAEQMVNLICPNWMLDRIRESNV